jgi:hypothetical protein
MANYCRAVTKSLRGTKPLLKTQTNLADIGIININKHYAK